MVCLYSDRHLSCIVIGRPLHGVASFWFIIVVFVVAVAAVVVYGSVSVEVGPLPRAALRAHISWNSSASVATPAASLCGREIGMRHVRFAHFFFKKVKIYLSYFFSGGGGGRGTPASNPLSFTRILERIGVGALWMEFDWMRGNVEMRRRSHQDPSPSHLFHRNQRISTHHWNPTEWLVKFFDWVVMGWYWGSLHVVVGKDYTVFFVKFLCV